jgi:hypothetical protein
LKIYLSHTTDVAQKLRRQRTLQRITEVATRGGPPQCTAPLRFKKTFLAALAQIDATTETEDIRTGKEAACRQVGAQKFGKRQQLLAFTATAVESFCLGNAGARTQAIASDSGYLGCSCLCCYVATSHFVPSSPLRTACTPTL